MSEINWNNFDNSYFLEYSHLIVQVVPRFSVKMMFYRRIHVVESYLIKLLLYRLKFCNFTEIGLSHGCFPSSFYQNIRGQLLLYFKRYLKSYTGGCNNNLILAKVYCISVILLKNYFGQVWSIESLYYVLSLWYTVYSITFVLAQLWKRR